MLQPFINNFFKADVIIRGTAHQQLLICKEQVLL